MPCHLKSCQLLHSCTEKFNMTSRTLRKQACSHRQKLCLQSRHLVNSTSDWCRHLANSTKHNIMLDYGPLAPLCEKMTSSTKPEVHNVLFCCQRRTEPLTETLMKFGCMVFSYTSWQTYIQTRWMQYREGHSRSSELPLFDTLYITSY